MHVHVYVYVAELACTLTNCLVVTSSDNGLSSGSINSAHYIKNQSKWGFLRQLLHGQRIPSCEIN